MKRMAFGAIYDVKLPEIELDPLRTGSNANWIYWLRQSLPLRQRRVKGTPAMKALEPQKLHGLSLSARQLFNLVLVVGLGLGLSACNSLGLGSSSSAPATSETESGSSGFSFGNVLYGGSVPPSRPPEEEDIECPAPIYTAEDSVIRVGTDSVRHQISIANVARECRIIQGKLVISVGVEARVLLGPAGSAGTYTAPVQIIMKRGTKIVASRTTRGSVTILAGSSMGQIVVVEKDFSVSKDGEELSITVNLKGGEPSVSPVAKNKAR